MAKIISQTFVVTVSRLARDGDHTAQFVADDFAANLEAVAQELAGTDAMVEITGVDHE
jgi:hypothetical protein